jgi:hypothetical protein
MGPRFQFAKYCVRTNIVRMDVHVVELEVYFLQDICLYN